MQFFTFKFIAHITSNSHREGIFHRVLFHRGQYSGGSFPSEQYSGDVSPREVGLRERIFFLIAVLRGAIHLSVNFPPALFIFRVLEA